MPQNTGNTTAFIEATQYSGFILENLHDALLPDNFSRNVSDFGTGTTLNIKTVGAASIQDVSEGSPMVFNAIDTGTITMSISEYIGDAWSISDELRQDGVQLEQLQAMRAMEATRAIQETYETKFLAACNDAQTDDDGNTINGLKHRGIGSGANRQLVEGDFIDMALAFDKANVPANGRIAIVDPVVGATINKLVTLSAGLDRTPQFEQAWSTGFVQNHKFVGNIFGWDIYTSNRLAVRTTASSSLTQIDGTADNAEIGDVANIFMCIADDNTRPIMNAWRLQPSVEGWRDPDNREDKFQATARFGFGAQRVDTLGVVFTSPTATA